MQDGNLFHLASNKCQCVNRGQFIVVKAPLKTTPHCYRNHPFSLQENNILDSGQIPVNLICIRTDRKGKIVINLKWFIMLKDKNLADLVGIHHYCIAEEKLVQAKVCNNYQEASLKVYKNTLRWNYLSTSVKSSCWQAGASEGIFYQTFYAEDSMLDLFGKFIV